MKDPKVSIILLNWNGKKDTLECFASLSKLSYSNVEIILVDNGSTDDSIEVFKKQYPQFTYIETHENLGFAGGNNVGLKYALSTDSQYFLLLNNDTTVDPDFLHPLVDAAKKHPQGGIFGTKILSYSNPEVIDHLGGFWNPKRAEFDTWGKEIPDEKDIPERQVDYVCGCSFFITKDVLEKIGLLEPRFFLLWEETDYCFRARKNGFEVWSIPKSKIWHKVSSSFVGGKPHMHYFWWRSRLLWIERNCTKFEKKRIYRKIIFPELFKQARHFVLKSLQFVFCSKEKRVETRRKITRYRAGITGAKDFWIKRFGNGPSWLFKVKK